MTFWICNECGRSFRIPELAENHEVNSHPDKRYCQYTLETTERLEERLIK